MPETDSEKLEKFLSLPIEQQQVLILRLKGVEFKDIEEILDLSPTTIYTYQDSGFKALGVNSRNFKEEYSSALRNHDPVNFGIM